MLEHGSHVVGAAGIDREVIGKCGAFLGFVHGLHF
jgi:hypothetical protein